jgi:hypothetical protein
VSTTDRVWGALTSMVKLEAQFELLTGAALVKRLKGD